MTDTLSEALEALDLLVDIAGPVVGFEKQPEIDSCERKIKKALKKLDKVKG